eukprot:scaffold23823_cov44-Tisochrysis_lutea.AAC.1
MESLFIVTAYPCKLHCSCCSAMIHAFAQPAHNVLSYLSFSFKWQILVDERAGPSAILKCPVQRMLPP